MEAITIDDIWTFQQAWHELEQEGMVDMFGGAEWRGWLATFVNTRELPTDRNVFSGVMESGEFDASKVGSDDPAYTGVAMIADGPK